MRVQVGNRAPHEVLSHEDVKRRGLKVGDFDRFDAGKVVVPVDVSGAVTEIGPFPDGTSVSEALRVCAGLWPYHSAEPAAWVASDSPALAQVLAEEHGCEIRELEGLE